MKNLPSKKKDEPWFIRPHHLENLTNHPKSLKDDIFNTRYYSHITDPQDPEKPKDNKESEQQKCIDKIRMHRERLRDQMMNHMFERGEDPEKLEELKENIQL